MPDSTWTSKLSINHRNELIILLDEMLRGELSDNGKKFESSQAYRKLEKITNRNIAIQRHSKTAQLWLQYMDMVRLLRQFIKAERTRNWKFHLQTLTDMLPFLLQLDTTTTLSLDICMFRK